MTLTLDVAPEVERALAAKAARAGLPLGEFLRRLIERVAFDEFDEVGASANGKAAAPPAQPTAQPIQFSDDRETRNAQIRALFHAPPEVIEATLRAGAEAMAPYYAESLAEGGELTEMTTALQGEPFHDDDDD